MSRYFSKSCDPIVMTLLAPEEECHLYFSPKSCTYPIFMTIDLLQVNIISILTVECYSAPLPLIIAHFLLLQEKNDLCILIFSKRVSGL